MNKMKREQLFVPKAEQKLQDAALNKAEQKNVKSFIQLSVDIRNV